MVNINNSPPIRGDEVLVSYRLRGISLDPMEFSAIDKGTRENIAVYREGYRRSREHGNSVCHESPLDALRGMVDGVEQRAHTLEEQNDDKP
jgi:hypothetical protein